MEKVMMHFLNQNLYITSYKEAITGSSVFQESTLQSHPIRGQFFSQLIVSIYWAKKIARCDTLRKRMFFSHRIGWDRER